MFEEKFFAHRKMNSALLIKYGFSEEPDGYTYETVIMDGQMRIFVFVGRDGAVTVKIFDFATGDEYTLYRNESAVGAFVGSVREACGNVLSDISEKCFEVDVFRERQTRFVIAYIRETYGGEMEFLWEKYPESAIWRRADSQKWYGLVTTLPKSKLGLESKETVEVMNLHTAPERMAEILDGVRYFPGWHMNKKSWYTVILDGSVPDGELCRRIDESYSLAGGAKSAKKTKKQCSQV